MPDLLPAEKLFQLGFTQYLAIFLHEKVGKPPGITGSASAQEPLQEITPSVQEMLSFQSLLYCPQGLPTIPGEIAAKAVVNGKVKLLTAELPVLFPGRHRGQVFIQPG
ncbi:MAG TPA: hypothetical protein ENK27_00485 [Desulfobulbus sp.]|nr:hypothetical protein [Desulfobulbus sp.]